MELVSSRNLDGTFKKSKVYSVGIVDVEGQKEWARGGKRYSDKCYSVWKNMLKRCYFKRGEYKDKVVVCCDWHKLSNFKVWFDENYQEGFELDKDMYGGKIYSPSTCVFVPRKLNLFIVGCNDKCGSYYDKRRYVYQSYTKLLIGRRASIGRFATEREAVFYAKIVKLQQLNLLLEDDDVPISIRLGLMRLLDNIYCKYIAPVLQQSEDFNSDIEENLKRLEYRFGKDYCSFRDFITN